MLGVVMGNVILLNVVAPDLRGKLKTLFFFLIEAAAGKSRSASHLVTIL